MVLALSQALSMKFDCYEGHKQSSYYERVVIQKNFQLEKDVWETLTFLC